MQQNQMDILKRQNPVSEIKNWLDGDQTQKMTEVVNSSMVQQQIPSLKKHINKNKEQDKVKEMWDAAIWLAYMSLKFQEKKR